MLVVEALRSGRLGRQGPWQGWGVQGASDCWLKGTPGLVTCASTIGSLLKPAGFDVYKPGTVKMPYPSLPGTRLCSGSLRIILTI